MIVATDIKQLIPQREPMLMTDRMEEAQDDTATTSFAIRTGNIFVSRGGELDEVALIENMAQSASALAGLKALSNGATEPPVGYIGEVKNFRCISRPHIGDELHTHIRMGMTVGGVTIVDCTIINGNQTIATAQLKIFIPDGEQDRRMANTALPTPHGRPATVEELAESYFLVNSSETSDGHALFRLTLKPNCAVYGGHFPNNPVCPGVCNILMLKHLAQNLAERELHFCEIRQCRLTAVATPIEQSELDAETCLTALPEGLTLTATLTDKEKIFVKLKGELH